MLVASDGLYCYLLHVYQSVCFTTQQTDLVNMVYIQSNSPYILFAITTTGIQTQDIPDHNQNVTNDALDRSAMKADLVAYLYMKLKFNYQFLS